MWEKLLNVLTRNPAIKRSFWHLWYQQISRRCPWDSVVFLNYGYAALGGDDSPPELGEYDETNRHAIQLYQHLASKINMTGKAVLEVGSGRGGGASFVARCLGPKSVIGLDLSSAAVDFCKRSHRVRGLRFQVGDAENLPFGENQFDIVMNVESSHCYPRINRFLSEVCRVLRPGGHFLFCDVRRREQIESLDRMLAMCGLIMDGQWDITSNVLAALDQMASQRQRLIAKSVPRPIARSFESFAGLPGGTIYESFREGERRYISCVMHKPSGAESPLEVVQ